MKTIRGILSKWHIYVLWALLAVLLWSWIFGFVTDTSPSRKVTVFVNVYDCADVDLAVALEEAKPEAIRMVKVHPFSYAMFDEQNLLTADLYVVSRSEAADYLTSFAPLNAADDPGGTGYYEDGTLYGLRIYDGSSRTGAAEAYLTYTAPDGEAEDFFLFFGASSVHLEDGAARQVAARLLELD